MQEKILYRGRQTATMLTPGITPRGIAQMRRQSYKGRESAAPSVEDPPWRESRVFCRARVEWRGEEKPELRSRGDRIVSRPSLSFVIFDGERAEAFQQLRMKGMPFPPGQRPVSRPLFVNPRLDRLNWVQEEISREMIRSREVYCGFNHPFARQAGLR
jgi:hypothetical protein